MSGDMPERWFNAAQNVSGVKHQIRAVLAAATADDLEALAPQAVAEIRARALREVADVWQRGEWAGAPRRPDRVAERIASAQYVGDWLRNRAKAEGGPP